MFAVSFLSRTLGFLFIGSLIVLMYAALSAAKNLHSPLLNNILHSPLSFFDTTPLGRILNRFAKDIEGVDMWLPMNFRHFASCIIQVCRLCFWSS